MATSAKVALPEPAVKAQGKGRPVALGPPPDVSAADSARTGLVGAAGQTPAIVGGGLIRR